MENLNELFIEAGTLLIAGMVFVFAFLGLLVIFINIVLVALAKKYPDITTQSSTSRVASPSAVKSDGVSPGIIAAISSAVTSYRQQHNTNK